MVLFSLRSLKRTPWSENVRERDVDSSSPRHCFCGTTVPVSQNRVIVEGLNCVCRLRGRLRQIAIWDAGHTDERFG